MAAERHPSVLELERHLASELGGPAVEHLQQHLSGCERCTQRLAQMRSQAAGFSSSSHSLPARRSFSTADRNWKRNAMVVALVPMLAAAFAITAALKPPPVVPAVESRPVVERHTAEVLEIRPPAKPPQLHSLGVRGQPVSFGEGCLEAAAPEGPSRPFVLKHTEVHAEISGFVSSVTVTQEFESPFREPVEAVYVFPLPDDAAVNAMTLTAGGRVIQATIQKREDARRQYEEAKSQGRRAALLDQERPNIFTQSVANLLPGETVKVTLTYVAPLRYDDGEYTFNFPMVVGPRYVPGAALAGESQGTGTHPDTTEVIDASRISPPAERTGRDVAVSIHLDSGGPLEGMWSVSHRLLAHRTNEHEAELALDASDRIPNRDLILRWKVSGPSTRAALVASGGHGGTFALMVTPPALAASGEVLPKEMVFLIDTSCSMQGAPLAAAKRAMGAAIEQMNPADTFMLLDFADTVSSFHPVPLPNTPQNVARALSYLAALPAGGGTNQLVGIEKALNRPEDPERLRMVLLMTDGFIGNERQILASVEQHLGHARIFGFGIGGSVNHYLLGRLSEIGRGFYQYLRPDEDPQPAVERFVRRIERPLMTDVELDWGGLGVFDVLPRKIPDLFDGQPLVVIGRNLDASSGVVTVRGRAQGRRVELKVPLTFPEKADPSRALPTIWARTRIEELDRQQNEGEKNEVIKQITTLGLEYHLVTAYTSFVAVEDRKVTDTAGKTVVEPTEVPELVTGMESPSRPRTMPVAKPPPMPKMPPAHVDNGIAHALEQLNVPSLKPQPRGDDDEFAKAFGKADVGGHRPSGSAGAYAFKANLGDERKSVYIPPAVGSSSSDVKDRLGTSEIMEVVMGHKPALAACVEEQHRREPGLTGKLVMRWQIGTDGRARAVMVVSEEFKSTYVATCIAKLISTWTFPRSRTAPEPTVFPFKF